MDLYSKLASITIIFFFNQKDFRQVLLYYVSPSLLLPSLTAVSGDLCYHNYLHAVFIISSHHLNLAYFVPNTCHLQCLSDDLILFSPSAILQLSTLSSSFQFSPATFLLSSSLSRLRLNI